MNIALVNEYIPPAAPGGGEVSMMLLAQRLAAAGHQVVVVAPLHRGATSQPPPDGVELVTYQSTLCWKGEPLGSARFLKPAFVMRTVKALLRTARRCNVDVMHVQNKQILFSAWLAAKLTRVPVVVTLRDLGSIQEPEPEFDADGKVSASSFIAHRRRCATYYGARSTTPHRLIYHLSVTLLWVLSAARRAIVRRCDGVVAVSEFIRASYEEAGALPLRAIVAYNTPPIELPAAEEDEALMHRLGLAGLRLVVAAGKLSLGKGTQTIVEAVRILEGRLPNDVCIVLAGRNSLPREPIAKQLRAIGIVSNTEVLQLYRSAEFILAPTISPEPFSRAILEAGTVGRALLTTPTGGTTEAIIHGVNGILVPPGDARKLADAIERLLTDQAATKELGLAARALIEQRFNPEEQIRRVLTLYAAVTG